MERHNLPKPMRRVLPITWLVVAIVLTGCPSATEVLNRPLAVMSDGANLTLANGNSVPIFYTMVNAELLVSADYVITLCRDPSSSCPRVPPFGTTRAAYSDIFGYQSGESTAAIWQWRLMRHADGTYAVADYRTTSVRLR